MSKRKKIIIGIIAGVLAVVSAAGILLFLQMRRMMASMGPVELTYVHEDHEAGDGSMVYMAYGGSRAQTAMHYQAAEDHGYTAIADVVILDEDSSMPLPVMGGTRLTENYVGAHFDDYGSYWDQACIDLVCAQRDGDSASLVNRIESRSGLHTLEYAEDIGLGSRTYSLVSIDN